MARPKTEYRNRITLQLTDDQYEAVRVRAKAYGVSESRAGADLIEQGAFGMVGILPRDLLDSSEKVGIAAAVIRY